VDDGDRNSSVSTISSLKSGSIAEDIAEFVSKVKELKATFRAEGKLKDGLNASRSAWSNHDEYEGDKRYTPPEGPSTYTYLHGPLCNALKKRLNTIVENHPYYRVGNNLNVDVAIFDLRTEKAIAIFEVKTSASMSEQLYTAFGQLAFYKHAHGTPATKLYLVLPENERKNILAKNFFKDAAIELIFGAHDQFLTTGRKPLQSVISIT
jgi:hypothetical protein